MLRKLMEKENNMQDQVNKVQMETPRKKQRKILEVKTERKNAFDGFISRVNLTKERRQANENFLDLITKREKKKRKTKTQSRTVENYETILNDITYV